MAAKKLSFSPGDFVVYPKHGVGRVMEIQKTEIAGASLELYVLRFEKEKMTLRVPTHEIDQVGMPLLLVHGTQDQYVPARFSEALYAAARNPKQLLLIEGGNHNNAMRVGRRAYAEAIRELLETPVEHAANRTLPGDSKSALVIETAKLAEADHDSLMKAVEFRHVNILKIKNYYFLRVCSI